MAVKMGRREDLGYPPAPSPPRRASRAAYGYEYGYEWYGYAYQGLWYAYCATMKRKRSQKFFNILVRSSKAFIKHPMPRCALCCWKAEKQH